MRTETEGRIASWETRPVEDGYAGLHALADAAFSGAITANDTWLFMLDGRPIGLSGGPIESFAEGVPTAYVAPHPTLPVLFAMHERTGETAARYYTDDTPLADTAETLASSGFTGYVELSENVLSGEYYLVYHRGRSIQVAFVGEGGRLITDDEALSRANDEVGIYEVTSVALEEIELPKPPKEPLATDSSPSSPPRSEAESTPLSSPPADVKRCSDSSNTTPTDELPDAVDADGSARSDASDPPRPAEREPSDTVEPRIEAGSIEASNATGDRAGTDDNATGCGGGDADRAIDDRSACGGTDRSTDPADRWGSVVEEPVEERFAAEQRWREAAGAPSTETERIDTPTASETSGSGSTSHRPPVASETPVPQPTNGSERSSDELEAERCAREATEAEADRLRETVASLRDRLEALETNGVTGSSAGEPAASIPASRALSGTDLFVRYAAAGEPTLEDARSNGADRATVGGNLRLERYTGFDPTNVLIDGQPLEAFLEGRIERRFADWVVRALPFDLRETGHENGLKGLYDALPRIDRIDFDGVVDAEEDELTFDVVFRNRMGEPLIVASCIDTREPIDEEQVASLVAAANAATDDATGLAGAMLATTSFFDPGALETAAEATRSGLLGRTTRESYVTVSRRQGYHLCLIEMRDAFHVRVPQL